MTKFRPIDFIKRHKVLSGLIIFLFVVALAYGIPPLVGDGTERFSGVKKRVAELTLKETYAIEDTMARHANIFAFQYYVEDVHEMSPDLARKNCRLPEGSSATGYYDVDLSGVTLFGLRSGNYGISILNLCNISDEVRNNP